MSELRITGIAVDVVRWPLKPGAIVKIATTNAGIVGWGEVSPWSVFTGTAEGNATGIHHYLRPLLVGANPLKISTLMRQIEKTLVGHTEGKAAGGDGQGAQRARRRPGAGEQDGVVG